MHSIVPAAYPTGPYTALLQVGQHAGAITATTTEASLAFALVILAVMLLVISPAVWSRRPARRKAAAEVLDRLARLMIDLFDRLVRLRSK